MAGLRSDVQFMAWTAVSFQSLLVHPTWFEVAIFGMERIGLYYATAHLWRLPRGQVVFLACMEAAEGVCKPAMSILL
jgi:hypothetical protein